MKNFEAIQNLWNEQKTEDSLVSSREIIEKAEKNALVVRKGHIWSMRILSLILSVLILYFLWIGIYEFNLFTVGLGLMVGLLMVRIAIEIFSSREFKKIKPDRSLKEYSQSVVRFYKRRKIIHYIITPVIYAGYFAGFVMLLPALKTSLTRGFYYYIIISGIAVFIGLAVFILKQIEKELNLLRYLNKLQNNL